MKYLSALLILVSTFSEANTAFIGKGDIGYSQIEMHLEINKEGDVTGSYFYLKTKNPIKLRGNLADKKITLNTIENSDTNEQFIGNVILFENEISRITGKWYRKRTNHMEPVVGYDFKINGRTNPLFDRNVTCKEMEEAPSLVFELDDLGSGHHSHNKVDYHCPKSLSQLDFLQKIIGQASNIRSPTSLPRSCTGSIIYAQWRYYHFDLARLGYYPQGYISRRLKKRGMEYFKEWSYHSLYNRKVYNEYKNELEKVKPLLIEWYVDTHSADIEIATQYAINALTLISNNGFGSYFYYWEPEELVSFTEEALDGQYANFLSSISTASDAQKANSLRRLLVQQTDENIIKTLVAAINVIPLKKRSESPISNAIYNPNNVQVLLGAGYSPNHQNRFGKTPLYYAIQFNQHKSVKVLLNNGANVNHTYQLEKEDKWHCYGIERWGRTPLMHAAQHSDTKMITLLLEQGAGLHAKDIKGSSAVDYAKDNFKKENESFLTQTLKKVE